MKELQDRILKDGLVIGTDILKVNKFINHQVDPVLMADIGKEFATHFKDKAITKVVTIESSGIAPALMTAIEMGVPLVSSLKKHYIMIFTRQRSLHILLKSITSFVSQKML